MWQARRRLGCRICTVFQPRSGCTRIELAREGQKQDAQGQSNTGAGVRFAILLENNPPDRVLPADGSQRRMRAVSLFSSTHYHGTKETDDRLTSLEQRVAALEANRANTSNQAPVVLPTPTPAPNNVPR